MSFLRVHQGGAPDLSKVEAGKLELTFEAVSLADLAAECVAMMQPQANRERIIIRTSLPGSVPPVVADSRSVRQIVLNLLVNAQQALSSQTGPRRLEVSTGLEARRADREPLLGAGARHGPGQAAEHPRPARRQPGEPAAVRHDGGCDVAAIQRLTSRWHGIRAVVRWWGAGDTRCRAGRGCRFRAV